MYEPSPLDRMIPVVSALDTDPGVIATTLSSPTDVRSPFFNAMAGFKPVTGTPLQSVSLTFTGSTWPFLSLFVTGVFVTGGTNSPVPTFTGVGPKGVEGAVFVGDFRRHRLAARRREPVSQRDRRGAPGARLRAAVREGQQVGPRGVGAGVGEERRDRARHEGERAGVRIRRRDVRDRRLDVVDGQRERR